MTYHVGNEEHTFKGIELAQWRVELKGVAWLGKVQEEQENRKSVKMKWFLDADLMTKNYLKALDLWLW